MNDKTTQVNIMTKDQQTNKECRVNYTNKEYGKIM